MHTQKLVIGMLLTAAAVLLIVVWQRQGGVVAGRGLRPREREALSLKNRATQQAPNTQSGPDVSGSTPAPNAAQESAEVLDPPAFPPPPQRRLKARPAGECMRVRLAR